MKFKRSYSSSSDGDIGSLINMTNMIDILFNLVLFLLVSTTMLNTPQIKIQLPKTGTAEKVKNEGIIVTISEEGIYHLNQERVTPSELAAKMRALAGERGVESPIIIRGDEKIPYGRLMDVMDMAKNAGFVKLSLATKAKERGR
ncbi:MAG: biopolymer transporter ExbD [Spirochaetes bacterium]|nr:biopolymer transporter ExbD [Spirochaetota bacterium]